MIEITKPNDVLNIIDETIQEFMNKTLSSLLSIYKTKSLSDYGCVYYINRNKDWDNHSQFGLSVPISETTIEYAEKITLKSTHEEIITLLHGCFILNNDKVIDLYSDIKDIPDNIKTIWLDNLMEE